ncbi:MAG: 16S rRNA (uracil(1498)-N(3))-methyltransferase [Alphaproteobacteria bacterium]|nr:16S rRNA (uracil(1498)-N(3))-methyltransferase [Alphaproteobacteria bacterium]
MNLPINTDETFKLPRLFVDNSLAQNGVIDLEPAQAHYLINVLRRNQGDQIRLFNGKDGEWLGILSVQSKKSATIQITQQLLEQPQLARRIHLLFAPIKKQRMDWLIEKAVELGATDFHPILTQNTEVRKIREDRLKAQIFEAAEQCERLEIPSLHTLQKWDTLLSKWDKTVPVISCIERYDAQPIVAVMQDHSNSNIAILIGPEGGFTKEERDQIAQKSIPVTLGNTILRSETAVIKALIIAQSLEISPN